MLDLAGQHDPTRNRPAIRCNRRLHDAADLGAVDAESCPCSQDVAMPHEDAAVVRTTKFDRGIDQRVEHCREVEGRPADYLQNIGGCRLLAQRLAEFAAARLHLVEQAHIFDGNHSLIGEGLQQRDLSRREKPWPRSSDVDGADRAAFPEHRHGSDGAGVDGRRHVANCVVGVSLEVGDLLDLAAHHRPGNGGATTGRDGIGADHCLMALCRKSVLGNKMDKFAVEPEDHAIFCVA